MKVFWEKALHAPLQLEPYGSLKLATHFVDLPTVPDKLLSYMQRLCGKVVTFEAVNFCTINNQSSRHSCPQQQEETSQGQNGQGRAPPSTNPPRSRQTAPKSGSVDRRIPQRKTDVAVKDKPTPTEQKELVASLPDDLHPPQQPVP